MITSFSDPIIPQGGTILETVTWDASVPSGVTFPFVVFSGYGTGTTPDNFDEKFYGFGYSNVPLTGPKVNARQETYVGYIFEDDAPIGTYNCLTIVGYLDGETIMILDWKIDASILTIEAGLGATIISTYFEQV